MSLCDGVPGKAKQPGMWGHPAQQALLISSTGLPAKACSYILVSPEARAKAVRALPVQVMDVYQPGAIVVCGGADSLSGDRLGCFNLSLQVRHAALDSCSCARAQAALVDPCSHCCASKLQCFLSLQLYRLQRDTVLVVCR